jgi:hypothetical protein
MRSITSSTPSTRMPYEALEPVGWRRWRRVETSDSAVVVSSSAASPCLRRCRTLLTMTFGEIFAPPRAM